MDVDDNDRHHGKADKTTMATLTKAIHISKTTVNSLSKLFSTLSLNNNFNLLAQTIYIKRLPPTLSLTQSSFIHTTAFCNDLKEFFEPEENWGKANITSGRAWAAQDLRNKSNEDLHKLWYVLLKERNMLLTMEEIYKEEGYKIPSPERLTKVEIGMNNIEKVVRERNKAYHYLETGTSGERPGKVMNSVIGLKTYHRMQQYTIPKHLNATWHQTYKYGYGSKAVAKFRKLYFEKMWNTKRKSINRQKHHALTALRIFPNVDLDTLAKQFPAVDIKKLRNHRKAQSHSVPEL